MLIRNAAILLEGQFASDMCIRLEKGAVAAIGAAARHKLLAPERGQPVTTFTSFGKNSDIIYEHAQRLAYFHALGKSKAMDKLPLCSTHQPAQSRIGNWYEQRPPFRASGQHPCIPPAIRTLRARRRGAAGRDLPDIRGCTDIRIHPGAHTQPANRQLHGRHSGRCPGGSR